jgi:hypothetical protein
MTKMSCNCIVCAEEFNANDLQSVAFSGINSTKFKICKACLDSDPSEDYSQARQIVQSYLNMADAKNLFAEAKDILFSFKK